jgi:gliding motility-associated-like protein
MKGFILLIFIGATFIMFSQDILMSNGSSTQCAGNFYDSGGFGTTGGGQYGNNENFIYTICPEAGLYTQVEFTLFQVDASDALTIYNGDNTSAPVYGVYNATSVLSGIVQATTDNPTGCLTFEFVSDGDTRAGGWRGVISCYMPCQTVNANAIYSSPLVGDYIQICQGTSINFSATGSYPNNNLYYVQSDASSTFSWKIKNPNGGNTELMGSNNSFNFSNEGIYIVDLTIVDVNGCKNTDLENQIIFVSTTPNFEGTLPDRDTICLGESNTIFGLANAVTAFQNCSPPIGDQVFLPDGNGASYQTSTQVGCFNDGQLLTSANDVLGICLNMEHSYLGDLSMTITCPTGQSVSLLNFNGIGYGQFLGEPIDDGSVTPGIGYDYCFSMDGPVSLSTQADITENGQTIPAGTYLPVQSFAGLIGCELNGNWTITITDNLPDDNGYIFGWDIEFSSLIPSLEAISFTPVITSQSWNPDPTIQSTNGNDIIVLPTSIGNQCYTYSVSDDFDCNYDTTVCFFVKGVPTVDPVANQVICDGDDFLDIIFTGSENTTFIWTNSRPEIGIAPEGVGDLIGQYGTGTTPLGGALEAIFTVTPQINGSCDGEPITFTLTVNATEEAAFDLPLSFCSLQGIQTPTFLPTTTLGGFFSSETGVNINPTTGEFDVSSLSEGQYEITYNSPGNSGYCATSSSSYFSVVNPTNLTIDPIPVISVCDNTAVSVIIFTGGSQFSEYSWVNNNPAIGIPANGLGNIPTFTTTGTVDGGSPITATITVTPFAGSCQGSTSETFTITINPKPNLELSDDLSICNGESAQISILNFNPLMQLDWDNNLNDLLSIHTVSPSITTTYSVIGTLNNCSNSDEVTITVNESPVVEAGTYPSVCINSQNIVLEGTPIGGVFSGSGLTGNLFNPQFGTQTLTYSYMDPNTGCSATDNTTITVNNLPSVNAGNDVNICIGAIATISATGAFSYTWDNGIGNGTSHEVSPLNSTTYTVTGSDVNGCQNSDVVTVNVNPLPTINAGVDQKICEGESTTITAIGGVNYVWNNTVVGASQLVSPLLTTTYIVTGTDANGCVGTDEVIVEIVGPPVITANNDTVICANNPITLTGSGASTYSWSNGVIDGESFIPNEGTTVYFLTGTSQDGCTAQVQVSVEVLPQPVPIINPSVLSGTPTLEVTFENLSLNANSFVWNLDNGAGNIAVSNFDSQNGTYNTLGNYTIQLTASNGLCANDTSVIIEVYNFDPAIVEIPNIFTPNGDKSNDEYYLNIQNGQNVEMQIFNRWGNFMYEVKGLFNASDNSTFWDGTINGKEANEGVYFFNYVVTGIDGNTVSGHANFHLIR